MPNKVFERNLVLEEWLITDMPTAKCARWLLGLLEELKAAAPEDSADYECAKQYQELISQVLKDYRLHRNKPPEDPERLASYKKLASSMSMWLRGVRQVLSTGRPTMAVDNPVPTQEQFESYIRAIISSGQWLEHCGSCGNKCLAPLVANESKYCPSCVIKYTRSCENCGCRNDIRISRTNQRMVQLNDERGLERWYCKDHLPEGTNQCDHCGLAFTGRKNIASKFASELTASGICACANCAPAYKKLQCGHYSAHGGHNRHLIEHTEDDNRNGELLRENYERVCDKCYNDNREEVEHWELNAERLNGTIFNEIGSLRTFGVELEFCRVRAMPSMSEAIKEFWTAKKDGSLPRCGVEFASTVLQGDEGLQVVKDLCEYAEAHEWAVDARSGFHLHIGLTKDSVAKVASIAMGYTMTYDLWKLLVPPGRTDSCKYCNRLNVTPEQLLPLDYNRYVATICESGDRRVWCNWHSYKKHATVEIRFHSGTRNYSKVANWVKAHTRFCDWCASFRSPKKLYERLHGFEHKPRELLLILGQEAWKDRELARWFRARSLKLHGDNTPLRSHRAVRKSGVDPKAPPVQPSRPVYYGRACFIEQIGNRWYISDTPKFGDGWCGIAIPGRGVWTDRVANLNYWATKAGAEAWLKLMIAKQAAPEVEEVAF